MDKYIYLGKGLSQFSFVLFFYLWAKRNMLVLRTSRVKEVLIQIKFLLVLDNQTEVLLHLDYDEAKFLRSKNVIILLSKVNYI